MWLRPKGKQLLGSWSLRIPSITGGHKGTIYFDLKTDVGQFERLGHAVGLRWRIGSSNSFATAEATATLYGGGGSGRCP
jgi:hypothetical protein